VVAGGADIWGTADQGHLTLKSRSGDFDAIVQIQGLTVGNPSARAGLMVRQTFAVDSPTFYLSVNPPASIAGRDQGEAGMRVASAAATGLGRRARLTRTSRGHSQCLATADAHGQLVQGL